MYQNSKIQRETTNNRKRPKIQAQKIKTEQNKKSPKEPKTLLTPLKARTPPLIQTNKKQNWKHTQHNYVCRTT
jgi:hypothetical protein